MAKLDLSRQLVHLVKNSWDFLHIISINEFIPKPLAYTLVSWLEFIADETCKCTGFEFSNFSQRPTLKRDPPIKVLSMLSSDEQDYILVIPIDICKYHWELFKTLLARCSL